MQKLFNKVLVPVDFSTQSKKAIERAVEIAKLYHCSIHLLHVVNISPMTSLAIAKGNISIPQSLINDKSELEIELKKMCVGENKKY